MGATAKVEKEVVPVEADGATGDENVTKALAHVSGIVEKIAGMVTTQKEAKPPEGETPAPAEEDGGSDDTGADDSDGDGESADVTKSLKTILQACGLNKSQMATAMAKLKAAGFMAGDMPAGKPPKNGAQKTTKASDGDAPFTMANFAEAVTKAAAFTPARIEQLKQMQETLKLMLEAVTPGTSPDSTVPQVQTHSNPSAVSNLTKPNTKPSVPTMKSSDEVVTLIKSLAGAVDGLVDRVAAIEKARPASNSADAEGATDTNTEKSTSLWRGVL